MNILLVSSEQGESFAFKHVVENEDVKELYTKAKNNGGTLEFGDWPYILLEAKTVKDDDPEYSKSTDVKESPHNCWVIIK
jgi:hypothetical protein